jgi:hypothetical protein
MRTPQSITAPVGVLLTLLLLLLLCYCCLTVTALSMFSLYTIFCEAFDIGHRYMVNLVSVILSSRLQATPTGPT